MFKQPGEHHDDLLTGTRAAIGPPRTRPVTNSLYTSYIDNCRDLTIAGPGGRGSWHVVQRPGADPKALTGLAKINLSTGEILRFDVGRVPGNGAMLATAGDLVFHGDMSAASEPSMPPPARCCGSRCWAATPPSAPSLMRPTESSTSRIMTGDNLKVPELAARGPGDQDSARPQRDLRLRAAIGLPTRGRTNDNEKPASSR